MSWDPKGKSRYPIHWGSVVTILLILGGITFLILGSWILSYGLNGVVIDHTNPYIHFSETTTSQEITDGIIYLVLGVACFVAFLILFTKKRSFLFLPQKTKRLD
jgi:hypothetical protein